LCQVVGIVAFWGWIVAGMTDIIGASAAEGVVGALWCRLATAFKLISRFNLGHNEPTLSRHIFVASVQSAWSDSEVRFVNLQVNTWSWQPFGISFANFM
jgi:hypothetical protein